MGSYQILYAIAQIMVGLYLDWALVRPKTSISDPKEQGTDSWFWKVVT